MALHFLDDPVRSLPAAWNRDLAAAGTVAACAAGLGALTAASPVLGAVAVVVIGLAVLTLLCPAGAIGALLLSTAVGWSGLPAVAAQADLVNRAQKLGILVVLASALLQYGGRLRAVSLPVGALAVVTVTTYVLAARHPGVGPDNSVLAFLTLTLGWLAASVSWPSPTVVRLLRTVSAAPLVSLLLGLLLEMVGQTTVFTLEYTGVSRLQGASGPAALGLLSTAGVMASVALRQYGDLRWPVLLGGVNVLLALLTGTRGSALAIVLVLSVSLVRYVRRGAGRRQRVRRGVGLLLVFLLAVAAYAPVVLARSGSSDGGVDDSGRSIAWSYFYHSVDVSPLWGRGLGAAPLLVDDTDLPGDFTAQHNEYLRVYVEGGQVGVLMVWSAIVVTLVALVRSAPPGPRGHAAAVALAFLVYSATDNTMSDFSMFVPFGLVIGALSRAPSPAVPAGTAA